MNQSSVILQRYKDLELGQSLGIYWKMSKFFKQAIANCKLKSIQKNSTLIHPMKAAYPPIF